MSGRVYDRNYEALERFWAHVDSVLGERVGHESEDNHDITAVVLRDDFWARDVLRRALPDDGFRVEVQRIMPLPLPGPEASNGWPWIAAAALVVSLVLGAVVIRRVRFV